MGNAEYMGSCGYRVKTSTLIEIESFEQVCVIANKLPR